MCAVALVGITARPFHQSARLAAILARRDVQGAKYRGSEDKSVDEFHWGTGINPGGCLGIDLCGYPETRALVHERAHPREALA